MSEPTAGLAALEAASSIAEAERALDTLDPDDLPVDIRLGDLYDDLALAASEEEDFALAIRAQRRALELGCEHAETAQQMLAWFLLKDGRRAEGEELFRALRTERGENPYLLITLASARADAGREDEALAAFDEALAAAHALGDADALQDVRAERAYHRARSGLEPDEDDRAVPAVEGPAPAEFWTLAWFPPAERERASALWPELADDLRADEAYRRALEAELRRLDTQARRRPRLVSLEVQALLEFAAGDGLDAGSAEARNRYAAARGQAGAGEAWPPGRNEPCWCGSGRKYKRCCGAF